IGSTTAVPVSQSLERTGSLTTTPITEKRVYTLSCGSGASSAEKSIEVSPYSLSEI
ncbi:MAG: hypothetical protein RI996_339, partial [Candidatus Parcubacteria bacterium]